MLTKCRTGGWRPWFNGFHWAATNWQSQAWNTADVKTVQFYSRISDPSLNYPQKMILAIYKRFGCIIKTIILTIYLIYLLKPHYPDDEEKASSVATMIFHFFAFGSKLSSIKMVQCLAY